ncbi:MAG TPA: flagellar biosynthesis protein FlgM [Rhodobacteraceae bacterium]|nr:flagellar biosynthesis protein FlgM [Paracoccaceae bacterium]
MRWRGNRQSDNIEDMRGQDQGGFRLPFPRRGRGRIRMPAGRGARGGGIGIGGIIVLLVIGYFLGINPLELLTGGGGMPGMPSPGRSVQPSSPPRGSGREQEMVRFVSVVLASTEDSWKALFADMGRVYEEPKLVLFSGSVRSACGFAQSAMGPFYCPGDRKVYLDLSFFKEMRDRFRAPGDFAQAYVIAHEIGHHVQTLLGISARVQKAKRGASRTEANAIQVRMELQADCLAGVWAYHADKARGILESGDIDEALNAANAIGDDTLQKRSQGYVVPDSFTHGSSAQRKRWFSTGIRTGDIKRCNTFSSSNP